MGSIRKRNGRFQVRVGRERVHEVIKTFNSKKDATVFGGWLRSDNKLGRVRRGCFIGFTLADVLMRYSQEITMLEKRCDPEPRRLHRLRKDPIAQVPFGKSASTILARFRDSSIKNV